MDTMILNDVRKQLFAEYLNKRIADEEEIINQINCITQKLKLAVPRFAEIEETLTLNNTRTDTATFFINTNLPQEPLSQSIDFQDNNSAVKEEKLEVVREIVISKAEEKIVVPDEIFVSKADKKKVEQGGITATREEEKKIVPEKITIAKKEKKLPVEENVLKAEIKEPNDKEKQNTEQATAIAEEIKHDDLQIKRKRIAGSNNVVFSTNRSPESEVKYKPRMPKKHKKPDQKPEAIKNFNERDYKNFIIEHFKKQQELLSIDEIAFSGLQAFRCKLSEFKALKNEFTRELDKLSNLFYLNKYYFRLKKTVYYGLKEWFEAENQPIAQYKNTLHKKHFPFFKG